MKFNNKIAYTIFMGSLSSIAFSGCYWQYNRYLSSKKRWDKIDSQLDNFEPLNINKIIWDENNFLDFEYQIVKLEIEELDETYFIERVQNNEYGYFILKPVKLNSDENVILKLGWVPKEIYLKKFKDTNLSKVLSKNQKVLLNCMVKKGEQLEIKKDNLYKEFSDDNIPRYINLNKIGNKYNNNKLFDKVYLERIVKYDEKLDTLYPYPNNNKSYIKPYLTPQKHIEYCTFWGITGILGVLSIIKILI